MPERKLRETLEELHRELDRAESVTAADRASLARVADDIRALLDRAGGKEDDHEPLAEALVDATERFEADHPKLTAAINRVATALSNLGI